MREDMSDVAGVDTAPLATAGGQVGVLKSRKRRLLTFALITLAVLLVILLVALGLLMGPRAIVGPGGSPIAGLEPVLSVEGPGRGDAPALARPMDAAFGLGGRVYVADSGNNRIAVFSRGGRFLFEFGGFGVAKPLPGFEATWREGLFNFPIGVDIDESGNVYIADFRNDQIQVYDAEGSFIRRFPDPAERVGRGASGQGGTGIAVTDVAVDGEYVYATDSFQVVIFTRDGRFVRQFGRPGTGPGEFNRPNGIDVTDDGTIIVTDSNNARVQAFSSYGRFLWMTGRGVRTSAEGAVVEDSEAMFALPRGVAALDDGTIAVVDSFEYGVVLLDGDGRVLDRVGQRGVRPGELNLPNGIGAMGDLIVVADKENDRVQILRFAR